MYNGYITKINVIKLNSIYEKHLIWGKRPKQSLPNASLVLSESDVLCSTYCTTLML